MMVGDVERRNAEGKKKGEGWRVAVDQVAILEEVVLVETLVVARTAAAVVDSRVVDRNTGAAVVKRNIKVDAKEEAITTIRHPVVSVML